MLFGLILLTIFTCDTDGPDSSPGLAAILDFAADVVRDISLLGTHISLILKCKLLNFHFIPLTTTIP